MLFALAIGVSLPLLSSEASKLRDRRAAAHRKHKHSRAWWRRYYARLRKKRALKARQRAAARWRKKTKPPATAKARPVVRQTKANHTPVASNPATATTVKASAPAATAVAAKTKAATAKGKGKKGANALPVPVAPPEPTAADARGGLYADPDDGLAMELPEGWSSRPVMVNGERRFMVFGPNGRPVGQATLSSAWARDPNDQGGAGRNRSLGGIPLRELRRSVIDKMAANNGWVVGDGEQEINGRRVFVVNAQSGTSDGKAQQNWTYYFTETNGRIYSLTTNAPVEFTDKLQNDSNRVIGTMRSGSTSLAAPKNSPKPE
jgi:hypothetical protein